MPWPFVKFGGKVREAPPPPGVQDNLSFADEPGAGGTDAAFWQPEDTPDLADDYFPTVPEQDKILVHYFRPPADVNPQEWYDDRDPWAKTQRTKIEEQDAIPPEIKQTRDNQAAPDPRWVPPPTERVTSSISPSSYRFMRPFDQVTEHELNGLHLSMANNKRSYLVGGQAGLAQNWNNSYRLDPPNNDATATFVGDTITNLEGEQILLSRTLDVWSNQSYRLF